MVARGDLGVELPPAQVPIIQRRIVRACRREGKPVVVATQMLESMTTSPVATRAEASDVATAVYEGSDAVMLSAESASGSSPREAVTMMDSIIHGVEGDIDFQAPASERQGESGASHATMFTVPVLRYLKKYGLGEDALAEVAVVQREWAAKNPRATFKNPISLDDVMNSRMISYPFRF